jgi:hypothetical protein
MEATIQQMALLHFIQIQMVAITPLSDKLLFITTQQVQAIRQSEMKRYLETQQESVIPPMAFRPFITILLAAATQQMEVFVFIQTALQY